MTTSCDCIYIIVKDVITHRYCFANIDLPNLGNSAEVTSTEFGFSCANLGSILVLCGHWLLGLQLISFDLSEL